MQHGSKRKTCSLKFRDNTAVNVGVDATVSSNRRGNKTRTHQRWDSEREPFYDDIAHVIQITTKENLLRLANSTIASQVLRIKSWIYDIAVIEYLYLVGLQ